MTNGEKLCTDFPNMKYTISGHRVITTIGVAASFDLDWWNAEYKEPITTIDYRRAFKIACDLLNGDVLYGIDTDKIFELMMQKDGVVSSSSYEEYILNHLQELDQGQYASSSEKSNKSEIPTSSDNLSSGTRKNSQKLENSTTKNNLVVDCISRQAINGYIDYILSHGMGKKKSFDFIKKFVSNLSSITPQASTTKNDLGVDKEQLKTMIRGLTKWYVKRDNTEVGEPNTAVGLLYDDVMFGIDRLPSVTSIRPKGHWIEEFNDIESEVRFTCSNCKKYQLFGTDFCYHCGSDNREVEE